MKKIDVGIFENTHVTTCWRQQYLQSEKRKSGIFEIWLYQWIEREKRSKSYKRPHVENKSITSYCTKYFNNQGGNSSGDFA